MSGGDTDVAIKRQSGHGYEHRRHSKGSCEWLGDEDCRLDSCVDCQSQGHTKTNQEENESSVAASAPFFVMYWINQTLIYTGNQETELWIRCPLLIILSLSLCLAVTELNQTARTSFPKEYLSRKQNFQKASCAKWPLPSCRKLFRIFGGISLIYIAQTKKFFVSFSIRRTYCYSTFFVRWQVLCIDVTVLLLHQASMVYSINLNAAYWQHTEYKESLCLGKK